MSVLINAFYKEFQELKEKQQESEIILNDLVLSLIEARKQNIEIAKKTGATVTDPGVE